MSSLGPVTACEHDEHTVTTIRQGLSNPDRSIARARAPSPRAHSPTSPHPALRSRQRFPASCCAWRSAHLASTIDESHTLLIFFVAVGVDLGIVLGVATTADVPPLCCCGRRRHNNTTQPPPHTRTRRRRARRSEALCVELGLLYGQGAALRAPSCIAEL